MVITNVNVLSNINLTLMSYGFYNINPDYECRFIDYKKVMFYNSISHPLIFWKLEFYYMDSYYYVDLITNLTGKSSHKIKNIPVFNHIELIQYKLNYCNNPLHILKNNVLKNNVYMLNVNKTQNAINNGYFSFLQNLNNQKILKDLTYDRIMINRNNNYYLIQELVNNILYIKFKK